ncbi:DUF5691 domain-containing protein [Cellulomonas alba]|uniref:DUF5691 domain-containing protein n=1 Tax=Cellulomonas alba TaxID=3053467 RepID=A0ABT7SBW0_9CELL|nr:DUF5691 domain-containing protein [Cellulomonas alba]MDM7853675.1 DUF5691 domain-containing protein [Cellulomonas alba]
MTVRDDLATAALLGTQRAALERAALTGVTGDVVHALPEQDASDTLLAAAAVLAVARRATPPAAPAATLCEPAPVEDRDAAGPRAAARAAQLLSDPDPVGPDLLLEWLTLLDQRRLRVPAALLGPVLTYAAATPRQDVAGAVVAVIGERGRWLASQHPGWQLVVTAHTPADLDLTGDVRDDPRWSHGTADERTHWWSTLRAVDPALARQVLAETWSTLKAEEKVSFLHAIAGDVTVADEDVLQLASTDRAASVRRTAAGVLTLLPESAFARECAARALATVRLERRLLREHLTVTLPTPRDSDPFAPAPPGVGPGAHLLTELVAATPLTAWTDQLRQDPRTLVGLALDAKAPELVVGWVRAAFTQRDPSWALALLDAATPDQWAPARAGLIALVPPGDRHRLVERGLQAAGRGKPALDASALALLTAVPGPWAPELTETVATSIAGATDRARGWAVRELAGLLAIRSRPDAAAEATLRRAAAASPDAAPALNRAADLVHLRRLTIEELS